MVPNTKVSMGALVANTVLAAATVNRTPIILAAGLILIAVYVLMPRERRYPRWIGGLAAAGAVFAVGELLLRWQTLSVESFLFSVFALVAIVAGGMLVTQRNPVHASLSFALVVLSTCGLFLLQAAPFLTAATIIVYAGAIVVTFLFLIMLAQQEGPSDADYRSREAEFTCASAFVLLGTLVYVVQLNYDTHDVDALLHRLAEARRQETAGAIDATLDMPAFVEQALRVANSRSGRIDNSFSNVIFGLQVKWSDLKEKNDVVAMRAELTRVENGIRQSLGEAALVVKPDERSVPLSTFSGAASNARAEDKRRDKTTQAAMPAANVAALGRSLFTDYLIPVELAGTLLLVATIGAIAIASRPTEGLR